LHYTGLGQNIAQTMKASVAGISHHRHLTAGLIGLFFAFLLQTGTAGPIQSTNGEFNVVGAAVIELLQSRDPIGFAQALAPTIEDFRAILSTNVIVKPADPLKEIQSMADHDRQQVETSAKELLAKAEALHLDFSKGKIPFQIKGQYYLGMRRWTDMQAENESVPYLAKITVEFGLNSPAADSTNGDFKITVCNLTKFPGGWRSHEGVQWTGFPMNVADEKTRREIALMSKAAAYQGITELDDPTLPKLAAQLVHFIREQDVKIYQRESLVTADMIWAQAQKQARQGGPSRKDFDEMWSQHQPELVDAARTMVQQMSNAGIDLKEAEIDVAQASIERLNPRGPWGGNLSGDQFQVKLTVKSKDNSKTGQSLSGNYVLAADEISKFGDDWKVTGKIRWDKLPAGVVDEKTAAALEFENYVAKYRRMPPGTAAPEIEFTRLDNEQKMKLSDLRGKVVVLDFWATWCGPCQEPMAKLQTLRQAHPDWKDTVAIIPLSIDDTLKQVRDHVDKRGWTNTFNVWAGDGGWMSAPAKTFRVTAVPTSYVIDAGGKIDEAGFPDEDRIVQTVNGLLKAQKQ
jgi:thiol-disulfide isomerase/thioredoxin